MSNRNMSNASSNRSNRNNHADDCESDYDTSNNAIQTQDHEESILDKMYTRDLLEVLPENDLKLAEREMNKHINTLRARSKKTHEYEVELCYIQDEINRRAAVLNHMSFKEV